MTFRVLHFGRKFKWSLFLKIIPISCLASINTVHLENNTFPSIQPESLCPSKKLKKLSQLSTIRDGYVFEVDESQHNIVGTGSRSKVLTARDTRTGKTVAIKKIRRDDLSHHRWEEEICIMRKVMEHRNCIRLIDFYEDRDDFYIIMEFAEGGELFQKLESNGRFSEGEAARIMIQILQALNHLHSNGIVHFDIKPENIILRHYGDNMIPEVKLADFGSAFWKDDISDVRYCTLSYSAPEVVQRSCAIDEKADIWSVGVLMYVLLSGKHPFQTVMEHSEEKLREKIISVDPDFSTFCMRHISPTAKDLIRQLMSKDRKKRPSAEEALSHPWFEAVLPLST